MKRKVPHRRATYSRIRVAGRPGPLRGRASHSLAASATATSRRCPRVCKCMPAKRTTHDSCALVRTRVVSCNLHNSAWSPRSSAFVQKSTGPRAAFIRTGDVQILDAFTSFLLKLQHPGPSPVHPNVGRQLHRRSAAAITPPSPNTSIDDSFVSVLFVHQRCFISDKKLRGSRQEFAGPCSSILVACTLVAEHAATRLGQQHQEGPTWKSSALCLSGLSTSQSAVPCTLRQLHPVRTPCLPHVFTNFDPTNDGFFSRLNPSRRVASASLHCRLRKVYP